NLGSADAFVTKVNPTGSGVVYSGYIGGSGSDVGAGIAVDPLGNAYVTGSTDSNEATFPVAVGPDLSHNGGTDAFVAKICLVSNPALIASIPVGNAPAGVAVNPLTNRAYVVNE